MESGFILAHILPVLFIGATDKLDKNYNYNENLKLQKAIKDGCRGAFWDILQQINF